MSKFSPPPPPLFKWTLSPTFSVLLCLFQFISIPLSSCLSTHPFAVTSPPLVDPWRVAFSLSLSLIFIFSLSPGASPSFNFMLILLPFFCCIAPYLLRRVGSAQSPSTLSRKSRLSQVKSTFIGGPLQRKKDNEIRFFFPPYTLNCVSFNTVKSYCICTSDALWIIDIHPKML